MPATSIPWKINGEYNGPDEPAATNWYQLICFLIYSAPLERRILKATVCARRHNSVQQDWRGILPQAQSCLFVDHTDKLENAYVMLSVSLNEAIALRRNGDSSKASEEIEVVGELCSRLALRINAVLHAMSQYARHFGIVPNLSLLDADNFHGERAQRAARHSNLVSQVLLSERSQFLNKLNTLDELVDEISDDFIEIAKQVAAGLSSISLRMWEILEQSHFDLNTCLRETDVLLKSFLFVLPEERLAGFDFTICGLARARRPNRVCNTPLLRLIRARRMAGVAGE
jgi:hypothetical protein